MEVFLNINLCSKRLSMLRKCIIVGYAYRLWSRELNWVDENSHVCIGEASAWIAASSAKSFVSTL